MSQKMYNSGEEYFDVVTSKCLEKFEQADKIDAIELSIQIMNTKDFPMHAPVHHYLVPAVLLTATRKVQGHNLEVLERDLEVALERAMQVPGGSCGFFGACGACVGCGIFFSLITDTSPYSTNTWSITNRATANALAVNADITGPRCCKRCTWLSLLSVRQSLEEDLSLEILMEDQSEIECVFYERNDECIKQACPFYPKEVLVR